MYLYTKIKVLDDCWWTLHIIFCNIKVELRVKAATLTSAPYFKPLFMSLRQPHSLWSSCGSNPFECHKAVTAARMLSGRYLTDKLQGTGPRIKLAAVSYQHAPLSLMAPWNISCSTAGHWTLCVQVFSDYAKKFLSRVMNYQGSSA